jgi:branched-chain amino acid transport system substrate-binding protein
MALLMRGLHAVGSEPTRSSFINALSQVKDFDALGLLGSHKLDLSRNGTVVFGPDNCVYITQLVGSSFRLVDGADPICGSVIPGKTVSGS